MQAIMSRLRDWIADRRAIQNHIRINRKPKRVQVGTRVYLVQPKVRRLP